MKLHALIDQLQRLASGPARDLDVVAYFEGGVLELNVIDAQVYVDQLGSYVELTTTERRAQPAPDPMSAEVRMSDPCGSSWCSLRGCEAPGPNPPCGGAPGARP